MNQRRSLSSPDPFFKIRVDLERWRRQREPGGRIPARLWSVAVGLAREHGVSRTSSALRLDYYTLKDRLEADTSKSPPVADVRTGGGFVEIPFEIPQPTSVPECVVLLEDARGTRLRIELRGRAASVEGIDALSQSLWRGADRKQES
jgi:hypothetical protein